MNVSQDSKIWLDYHRVHSKDNTIRAYEFTIAKFDQKLIRMNLEIGGILFRNSVGRLEQKSR